MKRSWFAPFRLPLCTAAILVLVWQVLRIALVLVHRSAIRSADEGMRLFLGGLHIDVVAALCVVTPLALWGVLKKRPWAGPSEVARWRRWIPLVWPSRWKLAGMMFVAGWVLVFLAVSEWFFFDEFQSRFNTVAIDYLIYPHEVFTNLHESYNLPVIFSAVFLGGALLTWASLCAGRPTTSEGVGLARRLRGAAAWVAVVGAACLSVRRSETAFSSERVANELANNGLASGLRAARTRHLDYAAFYPTMDRREAFLKVRKLLADSGGSLAAPEPPPAPLPRSDGKIDAVENEAWMAAAAASLQRRIHGDPSLPKLNVCILVQESLGSEFWGVLGRKKRSGRIDSLTVHLDRLAASEGLLFDQIYADGNRTIRGLEAIFSSFPPLPGDSILARDKTENVETIARVLKRDGYQSLFVYGGRGTFDYISSYALANGWDRLIQQWDFKNPAHTTAWGVSDEDAYSRMIEEMRLLHATGQPFLICNMSLSNHLPFTYPTGRIPEDPDEKSRKHAIKYCDWALNQFFTHAKLEAFWHDTIFVVVADHGARVYGSQTIPLKSYEIPLLILGPAVVKEPRRISTLGCQLDVAPTILGLIGRPYDSMFFGRDLLQEADSGRSRCLMHHNRSIAIYRDHRQIVFDLNKEIEYWAGDPRVPAMEKLSSTDAEAEALRDEGIALFQVADELYNARKYRRQETPTPITSAGTSRRAGVPSSR
jgi:Sulfatase